MALINLKPREAALIEQFRWNTANAKQSQRAQALLWPDEGDGVEEIAERLRVMRRTSAWATLTDNLKALPQFR